jgi:hypothetical protein
VAPYERRRCNATSSPCACPFSAIYAPAPCFPRRITVALVMLHKKRILQALYVSMRRRIRILLQIKPRAKPPPILGQSLESIVARHGWIAESLLEHLPAELDLQDKSVCEIGSGDCLAAVSLYLAKGASHVDIVDAAPMVVNQKQLDLLETLEEQGLPMDTGIIPRRSSLQLDANRVSHHSCYMENFSATDKYDLLSSFSVVEHVEEMEAFYFSCWKALKARRLDASHHRSGRARAI